MQARKPTPRRSWNFCATRAISADPPPFVTLASIGKRLYTGSPEMPEEPMKTVANFDRIGEENAFAVLARATALAAQGHDIINLGIGQPDFRTPDHIVEAAVKALRDGHHGYTPAVGILPLREAVAGDLHKRV